MCVRRRAGNGPLVMEGARRAVSTVLRPRFEPQDARNHLPARADRDYKRVEPGFRPVIWEMSDKCLAWAPSNSNMKQAGEGGADRGANILYRYENGALTNMPLWSKADGRFYGCGAIVTGVNDAANVSCSNFQYRPNIRQNGCNFPNFPSGYTGW